MKPDVIGTAPNENLHLNFLLRVGVGPLANEPIPFEIN
jgi:hypothetical protein